MSCTYIDPCDLITIVALRTIGKHSSINEKKGKEGQTQKKPKYFLRNVVDPDSLMLCLTSRSGSVFLNERIRIKSLALIFENVRSY